MHRRLLPAAVLILAAAPCAGQLEDFESTLERIESLARRHRYQEIIDLLDPLEESVDNSETRYIIAAELGRAYFHLAEYAAAHQRLRLAVTLHPERIESALYLQATSYILGDRAQALTILREVLRTGGRDLYLAVTLPGERQFLADPEVWQLLDEGSTPLVVDPGQGRAGDVILGSDRTSVARALHAPSAEPTPQLTARAGPHPIWSYLFSEAGTLTDVVLYNENLAKYTRYRVQIGQLDWCATPADAAAALGPPAETVAGEGVAMTWHLAGSSLQLVFGTPRPPRPPVLPERAAALLIVRLSTLD